MQHEFDRWHTHNCADRRPTFWHSNIYVLECCNWIAATSTYIFFDRPIAVQSRDPTHEQIQCSIHWSWVCCWRVRYICLPTMHGSPAENSTICNVLHVASFINLCCHSVGVFKTWRCIARCNDNPNDNVAGVVIMCKGDLQCNGIVPQLQNCDHVQRGFTM